MALNRITIDGKSYLLASGNSLPKGATDWNVSLEPSQRGDPSALRVASWRVDGPMGNSYEGPEGFLGFDYGANVDTRWDGVTTGPKINTVTLSTYDTISYSTVLRPSANGGNTLTPSTGANWENVDETVSDDDTTYNSGAGGASYDEYYRFPTTGLPSGIEITSIKLSARIRLTSFTTGGDVEFRFWYPPSTVAIGDPQTITSTSYVLFEDTFTTNPQTGYPWTVEELNTIICGPRIDSADNFRVTQFYITITAVKPNANGSDIAIGPNNETFMYVIRGRDVAKVDTTNMTLVNPGTVITLGANATSILTTETPSGTQEVSIGLEGATNYRVITTVAAAGTADTHSDNDDGQDLRIIAQAPDRVVGLIGQNTYMNILSASNTMDNGNWQSTGVLSRRDITPTGFAALGKLWVIGTNDGPYLLNPDTGLFDAMVTSIGHSLENCAATFVWPPAGVLTGTIHGIRYVNEYGSGTIGPENLVRNTSPVQGWMTAGSDGARWLFVCLYNFRTNDTYLLAGRPVEEGDPPGTRDVAWFPLAVFTDLRSNFLSNIDRENGTAASVLAGGYGSNMFYLLQGRTENWRDDTGVYRYAASGTWYGTEARRSMGMIKDLEAVEFTVLQSGTAGSSDSVTVGWSIDDAAYQDLTAVTATGAQRQVFASAGVPLSWATGKRIKPRIALAATSTGAGCLKVIGTLDLHYRERPINMEVVRFTLQLDTSLPEHGMEAQQEDLLALVDGSGPVLIPSDRDLDSGYWKITDVQVKTLASPAAGATTIGDVRYAFVTAKRWPQASGD